LTPPESGSNSVVLEFTAHAGQVLEGFHNLARVHFSTITEQSSVFAPLTVDGLLTTRAAEGLDPSLLLRQGRATIIGNEPLLESRFNPGGERELILYGRAGLPYVIESSANPSNPAGWSTFKEVSLTNFFQVQILSTADPAILFYRARK
ncbi:MAG TPA: hypothetical protein VK633_04635, partial [Verrucomicrobiae bacterium]|nr:hypothetical protein [Verrucomicrobiae bacterium]